MNITSSIINVISDTVTSLTRQIFKYLMTWYFVKFWRRTYSCKKDTLNILSIYVDAMCSAETVPSIRLDEEHTFFLETKGVVILAWYEYFKDLPQRNFLYIFYPTHHKHTTNVMLLRQGVKRKLLFEIKIDILDKIPPREKLLLIKNTIPLTKSDIEEFQE